MSLSLLHRSQSSNSYWNETAALVALTCTHVALSMGGLNLARLISVDTIGANHE